MSASAEARHASGLKKLAATLVVIGLALFGIYEANESTKTSDPLDALPDGAFIVASADLVAFRQSPLYGVVFAPGTGRSLGFGRVEEACGFDPLSRVTKVAVVVPEEGDRGDFGVAAIANVEPEEMKHCAQALSDSKDDDAALKKQGDFYVVEGKGDSLPRLAYKPESKERGLLLVGKGALVDQMIAAATGKRQRALTSPQHAKLRATLMRSPPPALVVTAVLPDGTRKRIRGEMMEEMDRGAPGSPEIMSGVLAVDTAGAALVAGEADGRAEIRIEMTCERADACAAVKTLIEKKRFEWGRNFGVRLLAGQLLDAIEVEANETHLSVHAALPSADLGKMLERLLDYRKSSVDRDPGPRRDRLDDRAPRLPPMTTGDGGAIAPLAPRIRPDEIIRAPKDAKDAGAR